MKELQEYFDNIVSRTWLGKKSEKVTIIEHSMVDDIYFQTNLEDRILIIGKTDKFYFILECFHSNDYKYSNALFNNHLIDLLNSYKKRDLLTQGSTVESFVDAFLMKHQLSKELKEKPIQKSSFKI
jgi:hypothetical protein